jgi:hypothetical protein
MRDAFEVRIAAARQYSKPYRGRILLFKLSNHPAFMIHSPLIRCQRQLLTRLRNLRAKYAGIGRDSSRAGYLEDIWS